MKRQTYFYSLAILWSVLSCAPSGKQLLSFYPWIVFVSICLLAIWMLTWLRLYQEERMRPELAILTIIPYIIYLYFVNLGQSLVEHIQAPVWGNCYFILWLLSAFISSQSLKKQNAKNTDKTKSEDNQSNTSLLIMRVACFVFAIISWASLAPHIFFIPS